MWNRNYKIVKTITSVSFTKKFINIFISLNIVIIFLKFWEFITISPLQKNVYDLFMYILNDYFFVVYLLTFLVIILFYRFCPNNKVHEYFILKYRNKIEWYFLNIFSIFFITIIYAFGIVLLLILISVINLDFQNIWSEFAIEKYSLSISTLEYFSPLSIVIYNFILVYLYILTLSLMIFCSYIIFQSTTMSLLLPILFTIFGVLTFLGKISWLYPFSFTSHTLIDIVDFHEKGVIGSFVPSILYWIILISTLIIIGFINIKKIDLNWSVK